MVSMAEAAALAYFALPSAAGGDEGPAAVAAEARTAAAMRATEAFIATPGREIDQQQPATSVPCPLPVLPVLPVALPVLP